MPGVEERTEEWKPLREFPIAWLDLSELKPHEALVEEELKGFIKSLTTCRVYWLPILVSKEEKIIIDGHHRWAGLQKLGAMQSPAILIDYADPDIKLGMWYPLLTKERDVLLDTLKRNGIETQMMSERQSATRKVQSGEATIAIVGKKDDEAILILNDPHAVDLLVRTEGELISYIDTEVAALSEVDSGKSRFAVIRKPVTKDDVRRKVTKGKVFPAKTTRHILPFSYQKIDVKIQEILPNFETSKNQ